MKKISFIFFLALSTFSFAQKKEKILFVGNSFTFYYNIPSTVEQMALSRGLHWDISQSTAGGATLKEHWLGEKGLKTKKILSKKRFSRVIFQDHSNYPLTAIDTTAKYLEKLQSIAKRSNTKYIYSTWVYPGISGFDPLDKNRSKAIENALKNNISGSKEYLIPVGRAFDAFNSQFPRSNLLTDDNKHTNSNGSYLAACVIFSKLSGQSSKGLPRRKEGVDKKGKKIFYFIVQQSIAEKCQKVADEIVFGKVPKG